MTYRMWHKDYNEFVTVYEIRENNYALIYSASLEKKSKCGWGVVKLSRLIPEDEYRASRLNVCEDELSSFINNIADAVINANTEN